MNIILKAISASFVRPRIAASRSQARHFSGATVSADIEHFISGWNFEYIEEFNKPGSWSIQTFNKILIR